MFTTTQELKPQVVEILNPQPEEEFDLPGLLDKVEDLKYTDDEQETSFSDSEMYSPEPELPEELRDKKYTKYQYIDKNYDYKKQKDLIDNRVKVRGDRTFVDGYLLPDGMRIDSRFYDGKNPIRDSEKTKEFFAAKEFVGGLWGFAKGAASFVKTVSNTNGNPTDTAVKAVETRVETEKDMHYIDLKMEYEAAKTLLNEKKLDIDNFKKQIEEKNKEIKDLQSQLEEVSKLSTDEASELNNKIQKLKKERDFYMDKLNRETKASFQDRENAQKQIQELSSSLSLTGKQLIEKDKEIDSQKDKLKKLQDYVDKFNDSSSKVSNQLSETKNNLKKLQTEYDQLLSDYKGKEKEIEDIKKAIPDRVSKALDSLKKSNRKR